MKERNEDMDHKSELLEDTKTFLDDLHDEQIINISRREYRWGEHMFMPVILKNKHGRSMGFTQMGEVKRYCLWLIEIGAVKTNVQDSDVLLGSNPAN